MGEKYNLENTITKLEKASTSIIKKNKSGANNIK